jgi:hypothetical protein
VILQLGLKALQQRQTIGSAAGKPDQDPILIQPANFAGIALEHYPLPASPGHLLPSLPDRHAAPPEWSFREWFCAYRLPRLVFVRPLQF